MHANTLLSLPEATVARSMGLPIVLHVHELPPEGIKRTGTLRWAASIADVLVAVSTPVAEMLRPFAGHTPIVTLRNGVPQAEYSPSYETTGVIGTIGTVSHRKGTDVFLRAAAIAQDARPALRFEHVGPSGIAGDDAFDAGIVELAASLAGDPGTVLLGRRETDSVLGRWDTFVLASRQDPFPPRHP